MARNKSIHIGDTFTNSSGQEVTVIDYLQHNKIKVRFEDSLNERFFTSVELREGRFSEILPKKYRNNTKAYSIWKTTLKNNPHKWECFKDFSDWCHSQEGYHKSGYVLNNNIFGDGETFDEDSCAFIPRRLHNLLKFTSKSNLPTGVFLEKGKYRSVCNNGYGEKVNLGRYDTPEEASNQYRLYKESLIKHIALEDYICKRISEKVYHKLQTFKVK